MESLIYINWLEHFAVCFIDIALYVEDLVEVFGLFPVAHCFYPIYFAASRRYCWFIFVNIIRTPIGRKGTTTIPTTIRATITPRTRTRKTPTTTMTTKTRARTMGRDYSDIVPKMRARTSWTNFELKEWGSNEFTWYHIFSGTNHIHHAILWYISC